MDKEQGRCCGHDHGACGEGHDHGACGGHDHGACGGHDHGACGEGHDHGACGGHDHGACGGHHDGAEPNYDNGYSIAENNVLMALLERKQLPVAQFALRSSKSAEAKATALAPVYIADPLDSLDQVKEYGALFAGMEEKGLIAIDYDAPIPQYDYAEYRDCAAYRYFVETCAEARARDFTFDTPFLALGGISLTNFGHEILDRMLG
jgi:hypothetical protein